MPQREAVNVGLLGLGTVGGGVAGILAQKQQAYARQLGLPLVLRRALVRDIAKARPGVRAQDLELLTTDPTDVLEDPEIDIVVDVWVGNPAFEYSTRALKAGKYVVTANKEVMAKHGPGCSPWPASMASISSTRPASAAASPSSRR